MLSAPGWGSAGSRQREEELPVCGRCEERIRQERALRILSDRKKIWVCDRCIEDMTEYTGYEGG